MKNLSTLEKILFHHCFVEARLSAYVHKREGLCITSAYVLRDKEPYISQIQSLAHSANMLRGVIRDADLNDVYTSWLEEQRNRYKECSIGEHVEKLRDRADNRTIIVMGPHIERMCLWSVEGSIELPANSVTVGIRMNILDTNEEDRENIRFALGLLTYDPAVVKVLSLCTEKRVLFRKGIHRLPTGSVLINVNINED